MHASLEDLRLLSLMPLNQAFWDQKRHSTFFTQHCNIHFYADDTILYTAGSTPNQALTRLHSAFDALQLSHLSLIHLKLDLKSQHLSLTSTVSTPSIPFPHLPSPIQGCFGFVPIPACAIPVEGRETGCAAACWASRLSTLLMASWVYDCKQSMLFSQQENNILLTQSSIMPVADHGDIFNLHVAFSTLKALNAVNRCPLCYIARYIYLALPRCLSSLLAFKLGNYATRLQDWLVLNSPHINFALGKANFWHYAL